MANTLTALQPTLFSVAQAIAREPWGTVDAINLNFDDKGVAVGDEVTVPVAGAKTASDFTPSNVASTGADATAGDVKVAITKSRKVSFHLTGEQIRSLDNGATSAEWIRQEIGQAMRTLRNECEADAFEAVKVGASRAYDSTGGAPFASNLSAMTRVRKILHDNGAPLADLQMVMDTEAGRVLRDLDIIQRADQAGTPEERRSGNLDRQFGFALRESAGAVAHTAGTATGYQTNGATAADATSIVVDTGSGDVNVGDLVTIDGNTYVIAADASGTPFTIAKPGTVAAIADNTAVSEVGDYTPIMAFERQAVVGIMRPPIMPANPTISQQLISDGEGMTYLLLDIAQYGQRTWELHLAWGFKTVQPEFIATIAAP